MKIAPIGPFVVWDVKPIAEIHAMAERAMAIPESMFVRPKPPSTAAESIAIRKAIYEYTNLCYYRRDLLTLLANRATAAAR